VREKIGAALSCKAYERGQEKREYPWQSFHLARLTADRAFVELKTDLKAYSIIDKDWPVTVKTPGGEEFSCWNYYDD
jgi:hypothetical protein